MDEPAGVSDAFLLRFEARVRDALRVVRRPGHRWHRAADGALLVTRCRSGCEPREAPIVQRYNPKIAEAVARTLGEEGAATPLPHTPPSLPTPPEPAMPANRAAERGPIALPPIGSHVTPAMLRAAGLSAHHSRTVTAPYELARVTLGIGHPSVVCELTPGLIEDLEGRGYALAVAEGEPVLIPEVLQALGPHAGDGQAPAEPVPAEPPVLAEAPPAEETPSEPAPTVAEALARIEAEARALEARAAELRAAAATLRALYPTAA